MLASCNVRTPKVEELKPTIGVEHVVVENVVSVSENKMMMMVMVLMCVGV